MRHILFIFFLVLGVGSASIVWAKSYAYEAIDVEIQVREDTTFTVRETQTFRFEGEYHKGWREIPHHRIESISDVLIYDVESDTYLVYTPHALEPTDPTSWGKYTYRRSGGSTQIEWYFDARDEERIWVIEYLVTGGISFLGERDEVYWNVLTDYHVPIETSLVTIQLPQTVITTDLEISEYISGAERSSSRIVDEKYGMARAEMLAPGADFTVAMSFPKGLIDRTLYWRQFFVLYWPYGLGVLFLLTSLFTAVVYWYITEKYRKGRKTIIAEYEPPEGLPPALGEVIVKEHIGHKTWPATIVDLAVRGYLHIEEDKPNRFQEIVLIIGFVLFVGVGIFLLSFVSSGIFHLTEVASFGSWIVLFSQGGIMLFVLSLVGLRMWKYSTLSSRPKDYILHLVKDYRGQYIKELHPFEEKFLHLLFPGKKKIFSTRKARTNIAQRQSLVAGFRDLRKVFYEEVTAKGLHTGNIYHEGYARGALIAVGFFLVWLGAFVGAFAPQWYFLLACIFFSVALLVYMMRFEVKLTHEGNVEREKWLGFKEFLYRVHRYRVQELTPETFQRYLPYAMIFDLEKKWAKQFEGVVQDSPEWYSTSPAMHVSRSGTPSSGSHSFSASAFSASLSSSFASSFSSSSGSGGASGGGGSAGGGGGGGGGGAS